METLCVATKGILFDMDGVLISSIGSVVRCWQRWAAMYGVPDAAHYEVPHGVRAIDIVKSLRPDIDPEEGLRVIENMEMEDMADLTVLPGVKSLLKGLPPERWAIVTSATRRLLLGRLVAAGLPVPERIISADMVERGKPDPEPYRRGAEWLGFRPEECVVVEDSESGAKAGRAAGCTVVATTFSHSIESLAAAHYLVEDLAGVEATIFDGDEGLVLRFTPLAA